MTYLLHLLQKNKSMLIKQSRLHLTDAIHDATKYSFVLDSYERTYADANGF